jgi:hypothetical protein
VSPWHRFLKTRGADATGAKRSVSIDRRLNRAGAVEFVDGSREAYDAIIAATGFRPDLRGLLPGASGALRKGGLPCASGGPTLEPGLYFCGFYMSPTRQLREIRIEARRIAAHIAERRRTELAR